MRQIARHAAVLAAAAALVEVATLVALRAVWHAGFDADPALTESSAVAVGYALLLGSGTTAVLLGSTSAYRAVVGFRPAVAVPFVVFIAFPLVLLAAAAVYATLGMLTIL